MYIYVSLLFYGFYNTLYFKIIVKIVSFYENAFRAKYFFRGLKIYIKNKWYLYY